MRFFEYSNFLDSAGLRSSSIDSPEPEPCPSPLLTPTRRNHMLFYPGRLQILVAGSYVRSRLLRSSHSAGILHPDRSHGSSRFTGSEGGVPVLRNVSALAKPIGFLAVHLPDSGPEYLAPKRTKPVSLSYRSPTTPT